MALPRFQDLDPKDPRFTDLLRRIVERIRSVTPACQVLVFGSFAQGLFTAASDIDLAVILDAMLRTRDFLDRLYSAGPLSDWPLDLVVLPRAEFEAGRRVGGICVDIAGSGIELYPDWRFR